MQDLEKAKQELLSGGWTCVLCRDERMYTASARGVKPLADWLESGLDVRGFCAADKVVGRATAFLYVLLGVRAVYAGVMSIPAKQVLVEHGVAAFCGREVPGIINRRGDGLCPFEEAVLNITDPAQALTVIRKKQFQMRQPPAIAAITEGKEFRLDTTGCSGSAVAVYSDLVLKCERETEESENGLAMLHWLDGTLPVPKVMASERRDGFVWTLMTRISGEMACSDRWREDPHRLVRELAKALKTLWAVDISGCPVDQSPREKLRRAAVLVENGQVDVENAEPETFGEGGFASPAALLQWLREHQPEQESVLSHGDLCLPNVFLQDWQISGFLDLGRSGAGDKWNDIAILWRSLRDNFGGHYGEAAPGFHPDALFEALGLEKNVEKLRWYLLMDELF